jgi:alkylation response protein AidB-like acyl-CoA dehydrogenase
MKTLYLEEWQHLQRNGIFKLFSPPFLQQELIINRIIDFSQSCEDCDLLLSALFQISGVMMPLQLTHDPNNPIHCQWLQRMQSGNAIAAHCMTEPTCGSDVFAMKTTAKQDGNRWIINGTKTYICNAPIADVGLIYVNLENVEQQKPYNLGCFLLDVATPGVEVEPPLQKIGLNNIPMGTIHLNNVELPATHMIGCIGNAHHIVHMATTFERLLIPIVFVGIMRKLCAQVTGITKVEIYRHIFVSESVLMTTLSKIDFSRWHRHYIQLGCLIKWQLSEAYIEVAKLSNNEAVYRDALSSWIYSGTNDVLKAMLGQLL